ncbi:MAG: GatB/YqeY domain-containing protein [Candidatus Liptonbacteria bacterium]|nr:GatB/YqeY domain-containing protein [Candidatus Liptonbacteria bacterium]
MTLQEKINQDLKEAMKAGEKERTQVLRFILAQIHNREIEKRSKGQEGALSEEEALEVLNKEVKKRKEALELFRRSGRADLVGKEEKELTFFGGYLPEPISNQEIEAAVEDILKKGGRDFGLVMKEAKARLGSRADGKILSEIVKAKLGKV